MSLRARATAFSVCSFYRILMRKVPHKSVAIRRKVPRKSVVIWQKVPHKSVKDLFLLLIISIFASCKTNDNLLWDIAVR